MTAPHTFLKVILFTFYIGLVACNGNGNGGTADTTAPVITITGDASVSLVVNEAAYIEEGATAVDDVDGTVAVTIGGDTVDTTTLGNYNVTYTATDAADNTSSATRTVTVRLALPFVTTWKTDNVGSSTDTQVTITTDGSLVYNYQVDWGDGQTNANLTANITHTYATAGTYTISISGDFPHFLPLGDAEKLLSVEQWGEINWQSMISAFSGASNFILNATDAPRLSLVTSMASMFQDATAFNQNIANWDVSSVTDMNSMFTNVTAFNQDITGWDVSSVTNMFFMFAGATTFNQNIGGWDVSSVTNMSFMFGTATAFNQNIGGWDVSSVTNMSNMFFAVTLSTANYDALLAGWSALPTLQPSITFDAGNSQYNDIAARNILTSAPNNWTINDGGAAP